MYYEVKLIFTVPYYDIFPGKHDVHTKGTKKKKDKNPTQNQKKSQKHNPKTKKTIKKHVFFKGGSLILRAFQGYRHYGIEKGHTTAFTQVIRPCLH